MGTLITLLPQSLSLPPLLPTVPLSSLSPPPYPVPPPLYPLRHIPALWYPTVLLLFTYFSFSHSISCSLSLSWFPASLCPSVPNLPWAGSVFFLIICFWFPRIRKPLCACCLLLVHTHTQTYTRSHMHGWTHIHTPRTHTFLLYYSIKVPINHWLLIGPRRPYLPLSPSSLAHKHRPDA